MSPAERMSGMGQRTFDLPGIAATLHTPGREFWEAFPVPYPVV